MSSVVLVSEFPQEKDNVTSLRENAWYFYEIDNIQTIIYHIANNGIALAKPLPKWLESNLYLQRVGTRNYLYLYHFNKTTQQFGLILLDKSCVILSHMLYGDIMMLDSDTFKKRFTS